MKNKISLAALIAISAVLFACSSGGSSGSSTPAMGFQGGEYGPISINMYDNLLAGKVKPSSLNGKSLQGAGAAADTAAATGVMAAVFPPAAVVLGPISAISGLVAADQVAAQINQINNELNYQESQIQQIYGILDASYNYVVKKSQAGYAAAFESNVTIWYDSVFGAFIFYGYGTTTEGIISPLSGQNLTAIYQGYINDFMSSPPSGSTNTVNQNVTNLLESIATNPTQMQYIINSVNSFGSTNSEAIITDASMSTTWVSSNHESAAVEASRSGDTYVLLQSAQQLLQSSIPTVNNPNPEFVALAESYNQFVNAVYLANVSVLQAMYTIEATNNYLNYLNYMATESGGALTQICPLEGTSNESGAIYNSIRFYVINSTSGCGNVATSVYYPTNTYAGTNPSSYENLNYQNAESAFIFAQQQLTQLYARRINMLYQQTMPFIYSDHGYPNQGLNLVNNESSLSSNMQSIIASTAQLKLIESDIAGVAMVGGNWTESFNLYQYPITNLDASRQNISNSVQNQINVNPYTFPVIPKINDTNYPTVYQNIQSGYYDGESISVYNASLAVASPTNPFNFAGYCGINSIGDYQAVESGLSAISGAIFCNNWSGSLMANSTTLNANVNLESVPALQNLIATPYFVNYGGCYYDFNFDNKNKYTYNVYKNNGLTCPSLPDNAYNNSNYAWYGMANNTSDSYTYYVATSSQGKNNFMLLGSSTFSSSPSFVLGAGEFYATGLNTSFQLEDGGFSDGTDIYNNSASFSHSALLQVTLPNGYNFPFYVFSYPAVENPQQGSNSHTYSSPLCPAIFGITASGIISCTQQSLGNGGLTVTTADGNTYYLNVLQPSDGQEMQYGYLQINTTPQTACNSGSNACTQ